jgi:N-acetylglucosaminyldiphosphoundecaprenol N-acetyl-beta-D-mannosaminyltransferase
LNATIGGRSRQVGGTLVVTAAADPLWTVTSAFAHAHAGTPPRRRVSFGGVLVDRDDRTTALARLASFVRCGREHQVVTVNVDFVSIARRDRRFRGAVNCADLAVADGMPLVWLSQAIGGRVGARITGFDLLHESCRLAAAAGQSVFLLGGLPGVANDARRRLEATYPGLHVFAHTPPYGPFTVDDDVEIVDRIRKVAPAYLFVALGAPRQDIWIRDHLRELRVPVSMGVGCTIDLIAGRFRRAPAWVGASGLEWAYRLAQEPRRLGKRYLVNDVSALAGLLLKNESSEVIT